MCSVNFKLSPCINQILFSFSSVAPSITPKLMDQSRNEGDTASFTCQADGEPLPTISWYFNSAPLDQINTSKYIFTHRQREASVMGILIIRNVQSSDEGTYTCYATNVISTNISSGVLTVNNGKYVYRFIRLT